MTPDAFAQAALRNPVNRAVVERLPALALNDAWLVAGSLFQTVWNLTGDRPPTENIADYDVFYFDPDTSWEAEDRVIRAAADLFGDLGADVQVRNQARVHLWYPYKFGSAYPALGSAREGIDRFLIAGTGVGLQPAEGGAAPQVYAADPLDEIVMGILRLNPRWGDAARFRDKAESYQRRWPWLRIVERELDID